MGERLRNDAGDPEVRDLDLSIGADQDISGLHIAMDDALAVSVVECIGHLPQNVEQIRQRRRIAAREQLLQRKALDKLHRQVPMALVLAELVDGDDTGVGKSAGGGGFPAETRAGVGLLLGAGEFVRADHLYGDGTANGVIVALKHDAHRPPAEFPGDFIRADLHGSLSGYSCRMAAGSIEFKNPRILEFKKGGGFAASGLRIPGFLASRLPGFLPHYPTASTVASSNASFSASCASTTATAATLTMSFTSAPYCRTWTGLERPITIGPIASAPPRRESSL